MSYTVGPKGQVVIENDTHERLGVKPGWRTVQRLTDDHLEIYFLPPEHNRSLAGSLKGYIKRVAPTDKALQDAQEAARAESLKCVRQASESLFCRSQSVFALHR